MNRLDRFLSSLCHFNHMKMPRMPAQTIQRQTGRCRPFLLWAIASMRRCCRVHNLYAESASDMDCDGALRFMDCRWRNVVCGRIVPSMEFVDEPGARNMLRNLVWSLALIPLMAVLPSGALAASDVGGTASGGGEPCAAACENAQGEAQGELTPEGKNWRWVVEPRYSLAEDFDENGLAWVEVGIKWGAINEKGEEVIAPRFSNVRHFYKNGPTWAELHDDKWVEINEKGEKVIAPLLNPQTGYITGYKWGVVNERGEEVIAPRFDRVMGFIRKAGFINDFAGVSLNGKWGIVNKKGEEVIAPRYDWIEWKTKSANGLMLVDLDHKSGYVNEKGEFVIQPQFNWAESFAENGLARVVVGEKWGYINDKGEIVIQPQFDWAKDFGANGLASIRVDGKFGYINGKGEIVIQPQFYWAEDFDENGLAWVVVNNKWGCIDEKGKEIISPRFDEVRWVYKMGENWVSKSSSTIDTTITSNMDWGVGTMVNINGKWGVLNEKCKEVISPIFDGVSNFINGLASFKINGEWGFINEKGKVVIQPKFSSVGTFAENGLARVTMKGKYGLINRKGELINGALFDMLGYFYHGLAMVKVDGKWGYLDEKGNIAIQPRFYEARDFEPSGLAWVGTERGGVYIDKKGEERRRRGKFVPNGLALAHENGKFGYVNQKDEIVIEAIFDGAHDFAPNGLARVRVKELWGYIEAHQK